MVDLKTRVVNILTKPQTEWPLIAVEQTDAMTLTVGYLTAAAGPWIAGVLHDLSGGWAATLVFMLAVTLAQAVPGVPATRDRHI